MTTVDAAGLAAVGRVNYPPPLRPLSGEADVDRDNRPTDRDRPTARPTEKGGEKIFSEKT